jgi:hypothetical protein
MLRLSIRPLIHLVIELKLPSPGDEGLNLSSDIIRAYHTHTAFFQAYAENCTPYYAYHKTKRRAQMHRNGLPGGYIVDFSLTERTGLRGSHARVRRGGVGNRTSAHDFWKNRLHESGQMFVDLLKLKQECIVAESMVFSVALGICAASSCCSAKVNKPSDWMPRTSVGCSISESA